MIPEVMFETLLEHLHWHYQINIGSEVIQFWSQFTDSEQRRIRNQLDAFERHNPHQIEELRWSGAIAITYAAATSLRWVSLHTPQRGKYGPIIQVKSEDHIQVKGTFLPLHESTALRSTCKTMAERCLKMHNKGPDLRFMHHSLRCTQNPQWTVDPSERMIQLNMSHLARSLLRFRQQGQQYHAPRESAANLFHVPKEKLDDIAQSQISFFYLYAFHMEIDRQQEQAMLQPAMMANTVDYHEAYVEVTERLPQWSDGLAMSQMYATLSTQLPLQPWKITALSHKYLHHRHLQQFLKYTIIVNQLWTWYINREVNFDHQMSWNDTYTLMKNLAAFCQSNHHFTNSQHHRDMIDMIRDHDRMIATTIILNYYKEATTLVLRPNAIITATHNWMQHHSRQLHTIIQFAQQDPRDHLLNYHNMQQADFGHSGGLIGFHHGH